MKFLNSWWGINEDITPLEIAARAAVMFLVTVIIVRLAGMRSFRKNNPFELVMAFLVGGILSRGVVGATPFVSSIAGAIAIIIIQKVFLTMSFYSKWFEHTTKGEPLLIYRDGQFIKDNMQKVNITRMEVYEDARVQFHTKSLEEFEEIYVEKTGEVSFIKKGKAA